eukprot:TRINITY_DN23359_c0_g1_i5.p1 TRINITY_DN23359_c0_g1~~TRINITY_DN23359_c0_g1_i5.p1  ORF type:complete len:643 (-),score=82.28 TRINITY_DN23359_c0_g1_i5:759-2687(-)
MVAVRILGAACVCQQAVRPKRVGRPSRLHRRRAAGHKREAAGLDGDAERVRCFSLYIVMMLSELQHRMGIFGHVGEIGVYKGLFYSAIALTRADGERLFACDTFQQSNLSDFQESIQRFGIDPSCVWVRKHTSLNLKPAYFTKRLLAPFRLLSVDGGHDVESVANDLRIAAAVVADGGVVVLDDFSQDAFLTVREGFYKFMLETDGPRLAPFLMACNKLYMTTAAFHKVMFEAVLYDRGLVELQPHHYSNKGVGAGSIIAGWPVVIPMARRTGGTASANSVVLGCEDIPTSVLAQEFRRIAKELDSAGSLLHVGRSEARSSSEQVSTFQPVRELFKFGKLLPAPRDSQLAAQRQLSDALREVEYVRLSDTRAANIAHKLFAVQEANCPTIEALQQDIYDGIYHNVYHSGADGAALVQVRGENLEAAKPCLPATKENKALLRELYGTLRATAQTILTALAAVQARVEGPVAASWIRDALDSDGLAFGGASSLLRSIAYHGGFTKESHTGAEWTAQGPHQDSAWLSMVIESTNGLSTHADDQERRRVVDLERGVMVFAGGYLFEASRGFWPAACHGVEARKREDRPRFSFVFQMVKHDRYGNISPKLPMGSCPLKQEDVAKKGRSVMDQYKRWGFTYEKQHGVD